MTTTKQSITQHVSVSTGQSFGALSGLTDFTTQETDTGQLQTTTLTAQSYLSFAPDASRANGVDVTEIGSSSTDSNGVALQSLFGNGNGIVQKLPYVSGAQWTNTAARTDTENDPGNETITATYAADGSYQEQLKFAEGSTAAVNVYPDGSGVYKAPVLGGNWLPSTLSINAPAAGQIQIALQVPAGLPLADAWTIPVWYPQNPPVLASDSYVDDGLTTVPSSCNVASAYASVNVEKIVEVRDRLDPVFGEYETDQVIQYTSSSYGLVCEVISDELKSYYDFSGQAGAAFAFTAYGTPQVDTTVSETLALQSAASPASASVRRTAQDYARSVLPRPSLARVHMILAAARAHHATRKPK